MIEKMKLGEILVGAGLLTTNQLQQALEEQKRSNLKLGQYLVREGMVSESEVVDLIARQLRIEK